MVYSYRKQGFWKAKLNLDNIQVKSSLRILEEKKKRKKGLDLQENLTYQSLW